MSELRRSVVQITPARLAALAEIRAKCAAAPEGRVARRDLSPTTNAKVPALRRLLLLNPVEPWTHGGVTVAADVDDVIEAHRAEDAKPLPLGTKARQVLEMLAAEPATSQAEIARRLGVSKQYVHQCRRDRR